MPSQPETSITIEQCNRQDARRPLCALPKDHPGDHFWSNQLDLIWRLAERSRWEAFSAAERSEIALGLDRRLTEAEQGNAYVWWDVDGSLLTELGGLDRRELAERLERAKAATP